MAKILLVILKDGNREVRIHGVGRVIIDRAIQELVAHGEDGQVKERFRLSEVKRSRLMPDTGSEAPDMNADHPSKGL